MTIPHNPTNAGLKGFSMTGKRGPTIKIPGSFLVLLFLLAAGILPDRALAQTAETITLISGNGVIGQRDTANKFTADGGATWQDASIITPNYYYSIISGTKYINRNSDASAPSNASTRYRTYFWLPGIFSAPTLTVDVHADNVATVFLNGVQFGQQPFSEIMSNFQGAPERFSVNNLSLFHPGLNTLEFDIYNYTGPAGFDYTAAASFVGCDSPLGGLVSWWPGDGTAVDYGNYNSGSLTGGVTYAQGKAGLALKFDGTGRVSAPDAVTLDTPGPITVNAWVNFTGVRNQASGSFGSPIIAKWGSPSYGTAGYGLFIDTGGYVYFNLSSGGSDVTTLKSPVPLAPGLFMYVAGVWNGVDMELYVNGEVVAAVPFAGPLHVNSVPLLIGGNDTAYTAGADNLVGLIDEAQFYDRALSAEEIATLYYAGGTGRCKNVPSPAAFTNVRLRETIPTKDIEFALSSATKTPWSVDILADKTIVEWRFGDFGIGKDQQLSYDLNLDNLMPAENRMIVESAQLIYNDRNNQEITIDLSPLTVHVLSSAFTSTVSTDKAVYQANQDVVLSAAMTNLSEYARTIDAGVVIEDSQGAAVQTVTTVSGLQLAAGQSSNLGTLIFNTGSFPAGDYKARLVLSENQKQTGEAISFFTIEPMIAIDSKITVDKISYNANENVTFTSSVSSASTNYIFENLTANIAVKKASDGNPLYVDSKAVSILMPGGIREFKSYWNTGTLAPGSYPVSIEILDSTGKVLTTSAQSLVISNSVVISAALDGRISVDKQKILSGEPVVINYTITNSGNVDLQNIGLTVLVTDAIEQRIYDSVISQVTLSTGASEPNTWQIDTTTYGARDYLIVLRANAGSTDETLAGTYVRVEGAPSMPSVAAPANGSDVLTFSPSLELNAASDPNDDKITYEFEVYADSGLTTLVTGTGGQATAWTVPIALNENKTYYWRSRAYDGWLYGPWMATASFRVNTVNDLPTAPAVSGPLDGTEVATFTPTLSVSNSTDSDSPNLTYNFAIATDPDFTQMIASAIGLTGGEGTTSWQVPLNLEENTWYYWRAQADDWFSAGPWSATARFFVNTSNQAPTAPVIQSPLNNIEINALETDITIVNSSDPESAVISYFYELDTVSTFDTPGIIRSGAIAQGQDGTTWHVSGLLENTTYYIRVKAGDGQAESGWSSVVSIFANAVNEAPGTPMLANPSNGSGVNTFTPTLSIQKAQDPDRDSLTYDFEVYSDANLSTVVTGTSGVAEAALVSWTIPINLEENRTYYWRARAYDGELASAWSNALSFMVNTANDAPTAPKISSPLNGNSVETLTPTLSVLNATDPDSAGLTYEFEIYAESTLVQSISNIPQDGSGVTSTTLTPPLQDNSEYQWRARAYDGQVFGAWTDMASFTVHVPITSISATINFDPDTLNTTSKGTWVVVSIELPKEYEPTDIDISTVRLEGTVPAEARPTALGDYDKDGIPDLIVKFSRSETIKALSTGDKVPVKVTGKVGAIMFEGVDVIKVIK